MIRIKRVYEPPEPTDGCRVLVDRLWPRGLAKKKAAIDEWLKEIAPSDGLRRWFGHDPRRWDEFQRRYRNELKARGKLQELQELAEKAKRERITLLFGARDEKRNNAVALKEILAEFS